MKQLYKSSNIIISVYLFVMLGFFPIFYRYQYAKMGDSKYKIFLYASSVCVVVSFLLSIIRLITSKAELVKNKNFVADKLNAREMTCLDTAVLIYFFCTTISYVISPFKEAGFWGADGWKMGLLSQFLFVAIYFLIAKVWTFQKWTIGLLLVSSAIVYIIAIFHRFDIDLLPIYGNLKLEYKVQFLSTMGQSSWYSSFLCTVFPIGLYLYFAEEDKKTRTVAGIYSGIALLSLVTQNTDSAFLSLFSVLMVLFYVSFEKKGKEFLQVIILILASFGFMGICQRVFESRMIPLDSFSILMSQSVWIRIALAIAVIVYFLLYGMRFDKLAHNRLRLGKNSQIIFWIILGMILIGILGVVVFIILNSNGWLLNKFDYQCTHNYLLFDDYWGNGRGFAWRFSATTFMELPFLQKLFGVGPDCFSAYAACVPEYLEQMRGFWGNLVLTNAHNEYLTKLYNIGIVGLVSYVVMLVTAVKTFMKERTGNPLLPAIAISIVFYMVHNIFCYEQVCCTPFLYILMGIGSNLIHNKRKKSTY